MVLKGRRQDWDGWMDVATLMTFEALQATDACPSYTVTATEATVTEVPRPSVGKSSYCCRNSCVNFCQSFRTFPVHLQQEETQIVVR